MSFVSVLLARELGTAAPRSAAAMTGTTPERAVVPRLASRFEEPGAPRWPGMAGDSAADPGETRESPARGTNREAPGKAALNTPAPPDASVVPAPRNAPHSGQDVSHVQRPGPLLPDQTERPSSPATRQAVPGRRWQGAQEQELVKPAPFTSDDSPNLAAEPSTGRGAAREGRDAAQFGPQETGQGQPAGRSGVVPSATQAAVWKRPWQAGPDPEGVAVRPRLDPLQRPEPAREEPAHIHVSIGRIEIRAVAAPPARQASPAEPSGLMGLDEYLRGRP
ncbi:hypothetical protein AAGW05_01935 [Arthrobacter sp. LAPM80]|uniref:hypothetical protein n=1 Tax=Arthrobacter sp. LAPM80 TaxID=3141788 RepID=UPI00398B9053